MNTNKILESSALDIIFENRNKSYGAYELRKNYYKRARKALFIAVTFILVGVAVPLLASLHEEEIYLSPPDNPTIITDVIIDPVVPDIPKVTEVIPPKVDDISTMENLPPEIVVTQTTNDDDLMHTQEDLSKNNLGVEDHVGMEGPHDGSLTPPSKNTTEGGAGIEDNNKEEIFDAYLISEMPEFPGGDAGMIKFLSENIDYPERAKSEGVEGRVVLEFVINKNGKIEDLKLKKGMGYGLDEEAMRVVNKMPTWKPGKNNGRPVSVSFKLPILFKLQ